MIIIEGLMGSGKTTLAKEIQEKIHRSILFEEPVDSNPYLTDFYKNPNRWALEMQYFLMALRFKMHSEGVEREWSQGITSIYDRSIYGDKAFADVLHQDGCISEIGYQSYLQHRDCMERFLLIPQYVIYLDVTIEKALERIGKRGREFEKGVPAEYLVKLDKAYRLIMKDLKQRGANVQIIDWNQEGIDWDKIQIPELCEFDVQSSSKFFVGGSEC